MKLVLSYYSDVEYETDAIEGESKEKVLEDFKLLLFNSLHHNKSYFYFGGLIYDVFDFYNKNNQTYSPPIVETLEEWWESDILSRPYVKDGLV